METNMVDVKTLSQTFREINDDIEGKYYLVRLEEGSIDVNLLINRIINGILKTNNDNIILRMELQSEIGTSANLLELEIRLLEAAKKSTRYNEHHSDIKPWLADSLRIRLNPEKPEIHGYRTRFNELPKVLLKSFEDISLLLGDSQRLICIFQVKSLSLAEKWMNLLRLMLQTIPKRIKIYFVPGDSQPLETRFLHFSLEKDYYWNNPTHLGLDLLFLQEARTDDLIHFLTMEEITTLLRLWDMSDVTIPAILAAFDYLKDFRPRNIFLSLDASPTQNVVSVGPRDRYEAEYRLCRELIYYYLLIGEESKSHKFLSRATEAIRRTKSMSDVERVFAKIYLLGDIGQAAREEGRSSDALIALKEQKKLCTQVSSPSARKHLSVIFNNLGIVYREIGNYTASLESLKSSLNIEKIQGNIIEELQVTIEIARTYISMEDYNKAILSLNQALDLTMIASPRDYYTEGIVQGYLGLSYLNIGQLDLALQSASKALDIFKTLGAFTDEKQAEQLLEQIASAMNQSSLS